MRSMAICSTGFGRSAARLALSMRTIVPAQDMLQLTCRTVDFELTIKTSLEAFALLYTVPVVMLFQPSQHGIVLWLILM